MASVRIKIKLVSTAGTGSYYTTTKNPRTTVEKLTRRKFDRKIQQHVDFVERKIK